MTRMATAQSALRSWSTSCPRTTSQKWISSAYVLTVAAVATVGFVAESTAVILLAALLSLPVSVIALPGYYVANALVTLVPESLDLLVTILGRSRWSFGELYSGDPGPALRRR